MTIILFILFCVLQVGDVYTTHRVLSKGGREINPVMASLFDAFGDHLAPLIAVKVLVCAAIWFFVTDPLILGGLCAFYLVVVLHNAKEI